MLISFTTPNGDAWEYKRLKPSNWIENTAMKNLTIAEE